jgi:hypothetical protein
MSSRDFRVHVVGPSNAKWDRVNDNIDVEVVLRDGRRFVATFFTAKNIESLFEKNKKTGECSSGLYLWAKNMIIVEELSLEVIEKTVDGLLRGGELRAAFSEVGPRPALAMAI